MSAHISHSSEQKTAFSESDLAELKALLIASQNAKTEQIELVLEVVEAFELQQPSGIEQGTFLTLPFSQVEYAAIVAHQEDDELAVILIMIGSLS